ncbi:Alpha/Beta hydrolase protein [Yarrowia lipolytica]|nr:Alpha/Beta hydrolase protein [Yarrowia lipolytica]KAE8170476.1 Alpha/Beta hydrolase protein [Yarrowia lipolytica]RMI94305.1 Alpha/Beta hydrolase protein [Yarrowia lipolytica]
MSVTQKKITFKNLNGEGISNAATYAAIVVAHPAGGVKEQTSGIYANKVAAGGFVTLAYDASYQGDSTGEPRHLEDPYIRTEENSAAVDYMTTLAYVDKDKIGILGVCASGGYTVNAAINDRRIKAVGTVSAVNIGFMYRAGWNGNQSGIVDQVLQVGAQARTDEANGQDITYLSWAPETIDDAPVPELRDAYTYYKTERAAKPNAPSKYTDRSLTQLATYDAFHQAKEFLTQPILMVAGEDAGTKFYSEELIETIKSSNKNASNYFVKGSNHFDMYDKSQFVDEAVSKFISFYQEFLE